MRMRNLLVLCFLAVSVLAGVQESRAGESVKSCLVGEGNGIACLGRVTKACLATEKNPVDDTVHECFQSEYVQWDVLVIHSARDIQSLLKGRALETFKAAQKAWKLFRTKSCRLPYQVMQGRAGLVAGLTCNRDITARRALGLMAFRKALK